MKFMYIILLIILVIIISINICFFIAANNTALRKQVLNKHAYFYKKKDKLVDGGTFKKLFITLAAIIGTTAAASSGTATTISSDTTSIMMRPNNNGTVSTICLNSESPIPTYGFYQVTSPMSSADELSTMLTDGVGNIFNISNEEYNTEYTSMPQSAPDMQGKITMRVTKGLKNALTQENSEFVVVTTLPDNSIKSITTANQFLEEIQLSESVSKYKNDIMNSIETHISSSDIKSTIITLISGIVTDINNKSASHVKEKFTALSNLYLDSYDGLDGDQATEFLRIVELTESMIAKKYPTLLNDSINIFKEKFKSLFGNALKIFQRPSKRTPKTSEPVPSPEMPSSVPTPAPDLSSTVLPPEMPSSVPTPAPDLSSTVLPPAMPIPLPAMPTSVLSSNFYANVIIPRISLFADNIKDEISDLFQGMVTNNNGAIITHANELASLRDNLFIDKTVPVTGQYINPVLYDEMQLYLDHIEVINEVLHFTMSTFPLSYNFTSATNVRGSQNSFRPNSIKFKNGTLWLNFHTMIQTLLTLGAIAVIGSEIYYIYKKYVCKVKITYILLNIDIDDFIEEYEKLIEDNETDIFIPRQKSDTVSNHQLLINMLLDAMKIYIFDYGKKLPKILKKGILYFMPRSIKHNKYTIEYFKNILHKYKEKKNIMDSLYFPSGKYYFLDLGFTLKNPLYIH